MLQCYQAFFVLSCETLSKKQEPLARPISWHQTAGSLNGRNILTSEDIDGGRAEFEHFKARSLFGNFSEQRHWGHSAMFLFVFLLSSSCLLCGLSPSFSSFSAFFLFLFYLSTFSLCPTDFTLSILWYFLVFSGLEFCGNVATNKWLDGTDTMERRTMS